jgi:hypothetical protein
MGGDVLGLQSRQDILAYDARLRWWVAIGDVRCDSTVTILGGVDHTKGSKNQAAVVSKYEVAEAPHELYDEPDRSRAGG